ncbi:MAG: hypothetical protein ACRC3H_19630 [Lachnospiraceae bacterium]
MKYRKKPVEVEAVQWTGNNEQEIYTFCGGNALKDATDFLEGKPTMMAINESEFERTLVIRTLEGDMAASIGDYIIKGVQGEFYPFKPDIFEQTYEKVEGENV